MILAIAAVGLFAMPSLLATYAGTHTIVDNDPALKGPSGKALDCRECHDYIFRAANMAGNNNSQDIWTRHNGSAADQDYTTYLGYYGTDMTTNITSIGGAVNMSNSNVSSKAPYNLFFTAKSNQSSLKVKYGDILGRNASTTGPTGAWYVVDVAGPLSIDPTGVGRYDSGKVNDDISGKEWSGCLFCHRSAFFYGGTHTTVQDHARDHGASTVVGANGQIRPAGISYMGDVPGKQTTSTISGYSKSAETGKSLNKTADAHNKWFDASAAQPDSYLNPQTGENYTKDYYTCMGCHTHADVQLDITKSTGFNATIDSTSVEAISISYTISANDTVLQSTKLGPAFK